MTKTEKKQAEAILGVLERQDFFDFYNGESFIDYIEEGKAKEEILEKVNRLFGRMLDK